MSEILDSGARRTFEVNGVNTGGVRDVSKGKGRCDLLPLDVIACLMQDPVLTEIAAFKRTKKEFYLIRALSLFQQKAFADMPTMILELAKHFEAGAEKYGEYNWQKGLPLHCYIDSGVRHYLKWLRGDEDEPHSSAFVWNLTCCIWTVKNKPEMDDIYSPTYTLDEVKAELEIDADCTECEREDEISTDAPGNVHRKTYLEDLLERLPSAQMNGVHPEACRAELYGDCDCTELSSCEICWKEVMPE